MPISEFLYELRQKIGNDLILVPTIVVIARDEHDRILLVHDRDSDYWTLPGGIIEPGETPADAAVREVWEEAHVMVTLTHVIGVVGGPDCETIYRNGDRIAWVATLFGASVEQAIPIPDGAETVGAKFVAESAFGSVTLRADTIRFLSADKESRSSCYFQPPNWRPA